MHPSTNPPTTSSNFTLYTKHKNSVTTTNNGIKSVIVQDPNALIVPNKTPKMLILSFKKVPVLPIWNPYTDKNAIVVNTT